MGFVEMLEKITLNLPPAVMFYCKQSSFVIDMETYWDSNIIVVLSIAILPWLEHAHKSHRPRRYQFSQR